MSQHEIPYFPKHPNHHIRWRPVAAFLVLNFGLTLALNLIIYQNGGLTNPALGMLLQLQMLLPAFSAIFLVLFIFKDHPLHYSKMDSPDYPHRSRWFCLYFLAFTFVYAVLGLLALDRPDRLAAYTALSGSANILGLLLLIGLRAMGGGEDFKRGGLRGGAPRWWLLMGLGFVLFYALQTGLNALFGLGQAVDAQAVLESMGMPASGVSGQLLLMIIGVQAVLAGPFIGLIISFGEEFGWRGYLQGELTKLGKVRGILLLGLIWGIWHYPIILMGYNYPGQPVLGMALMTFYTIGLSFVIGYAMLKTGAIWLAAYLHALNNQVLSFLFGLVHAPDDMAFSFGIGIYGLILLALVVLWILRDPIWRDVPSEPIQSEAIQS
jgi:membrane protease YdiL (CAAX protease family)